MHVKSKIVKKKKKVDPLHFIGIHHWVKTMYCFQVKAYKSMQSKETKGSKYNLMSRHFSLHPCRVVGPNVRSLKLVHLHTLVVLEVALHPLLISQHIDASIACDTVDKLYIYMLLQCMLHDIQSLRDWSWSWWTCTRLSGSASYPSSILIRRFQS